MPIDLSRQTKFLNLLKTYRKIAIGGPSKSGKTELAKNCTDRPVFHTDDWKEMPYADIPVLINTELRNKNTFILEGVQVPRCLRDGLDIDCMIWLSGKNLHLSKKQINNAKTFEVIWREWLGTNPSAEVVVL